MISLTAVENAVNKILQNDEVEVIATNTGDDKKGEKIVLMVAGLDSVDDLRQTLIDGGMKSLMVPGDIFKVDEIPKLGSGKKDFTAAKKMAASLL